MTLISPVARTLRYAQCARTHRAPRSLLGRRCRAPWQNPITSAPPVADYTGPAPQNADVQAFKLNLWENIKANNRCGGCHNAERPDAAVRAQRRRERRVHGREHGREPHAARSVAHGHQGGRRPQLLARLRLGLRGHAHRLDSQLGRRHRHGRHADPAPGAHDQGSGREQDLPDGTRDGVRHPLRSGTTRS